MNKLKFLAVTLVSCFLLSFALLGAGGKCEFCNGSSVGTTCSSSKNDVGTCIIVREGRCSYCGGSYAGTSCRKSPTGKCVVPKSGKCSYCAGSLIGTSCSKYSGKCASVRY